MKASCVLLTHQRHENVPRILDELLPVFSEVLVWNNNKAGQDSLLTTIVSGYRTSPVHMMADRDGRNLYTHGRYKAAMMAENEVVCTQDDDVLVSADKWRRLFDAFESSQGRLCCFLDKGHMRYCVTSRRYAHVYKYGAAERFAHEALVGWGAVFQRDLVRDVLSEYFSIWPPDELSMRKMDRIFTVMLDSPHEYLECEVEHLPGAAGKDAVYRQPDHWEANDEAVKRALMVLSTIP
jgi:hypothetical protein